MMAARARIAIVDDDEALLSAIGRLVRSFGYEIRPFTDARSFIDSTSFGNIDCVVTDIHMPGLSGLNLLDEVQRRTPSIPVIVMTAYPLDNRLDELEARGAVASLAKPISAALLEKLLGSTVAGPSGE